jgi:TatD DNase family protein
LTADLIDIGANLTHESFDADRAAMLARAADAGVRRLVITGADLASSLAAARLCELAPTRLWSTAGVHPHQASGFELAQRAELASLLGHPAVVAVGECGLDYYRNLSPPAAQRAAFVTQLELAVETGKPVFLHQRDAHADFVAILEEFAPRLSGGIAHCFTGGIAELERYLALNLHIGVTGWVCDERRGVALRLAVPHIPEERLMVETDAPYLLPRDLPKAQRSRRNEPAFLAHIAATVARLRGDSPAWLAEFTTRNAVRFFGLPASAAQGATGS